MVRFQECGQGVARKHLTPSHLPLLIICIAAVYHPDSLFIILTVGLKNGCSVKDQKNSLMNNVGNRYCSEDGRIFLLAYLP